MFKPEAFFDLASFAYSDVFEGVEYVWDALARLHAYLLARTAEGNAIRGGVFLAGSPTDSLYY